MILQPGVLALIVGSSIILLLLLLAAVLGLKILFRWDITSSSEEQLDLEKKTYLVSTLVQYGLLFEVVSVFLFIYTADDLHNLLVGAMCATG
jgi:ABC-type transport system involved in cytochrome c biogenesis permease component